MANPTIGPRVPIIVTAPPGAPVSFSLRMSDDATEAKIFATPTTATAGATAQPVTVAAGATATYYVQAAVYYASTLVAGVEMAGGVGARKRIECEGGMTRVQPNAPVFPNFYRTVVVAGDLTATGGVVRYPFPVAATVLGVTLNVNTAPVGAAILVDVNKNGTTIFTTQANRPTILAAANATAAEVTNMDVTQFAAGDYLTVDVDQIGSGTAGSNLTVTIRYQ